MTPQTPIPPARPAGAKPPSGRSASGASMTQEFQTYLRELSRLLAEGHAERYALIKGDTVLGIWDSQSEVLQAGYDRFGEEPFGVKRIDPRDPERWAQLQAQKNRHA